MKLHTTYFAMQLLKLVIMATKIIYSVKKRVQKKKIHTKSGNYLRLAQGCCWSDLAKYLGRCLILSM